MTKQQKINLGIGNHHGLCQRGVFITETDRCWRNRAFGPSRPYDEDAG